MPAVESAAAARLRQPTCARARAERAAAQLSTEATRCMEPVSQSLPQLLFVVVRRSEVSAARPARIRPARLHSEAEKRGACRRRLVAVDTSWYRRSRSKEAVFGGPTRSCHGDRGCARRLCRLGSEWLGAEHGEAARTPARCLGTLRHRCAVETSGDRDR